MTAESYWWMVSDLHLDADAPDTRGVGAAFAVFLDEIVRGRRQTARHLVLLGDSFEINSDTGVNDREAQALHRLHRIGDHFPAVFRGLTALLEDGVEVHVVCGNHDFDLARPAVHQELLRMLGGPTGSAVVHPWLFHVPGLLYAEHGSQHHDLNRIPTLLRATQPGRQGELALPPLAVLTQDRYHEDGVVARGLLMTRALLRTARAEREIATPAYQEMLASTAETQQLPIPAVRALARLSQVKPLVTAADVSRRLAAHHFGGKHDAYLRRAVLRIDDVMSRNGVRPVCYAFGHTHVADRRPLSIVGAYYANCGTWSQWTRASTSATASGFPYVLLEKTGPEVRVRLNRWHPSMSL